MDKNKEKKIKETIYKVYDIIDPTGILLNHAKEIIEPMNSKQFEQFIRSYIYSGDKNDPLDLNKKFFKIRTQPHKNNITLENLKKGLDYLKVPLFETVSLPFVNENGEVYTTPHPVLTGYVHMKRLQQMISKKNSMSIHTNKRSALTNQVVDKDKNSRTSDMENMGLITINSDSILKEFLTAKSDDMYMKTEMLKQIKDQGYVDLSKIESKATNKTALNTLDVYYTAMGIKTDLVTKGLLLKRTLQNQNKDVNSISSKFEK